MEFRIVEKTEGFNSQFHPQYKKFGFWFNILKTNWGGRFTSYLKEYDYSLDDAKRTIIAYKSDLNTKKKTIIHKIY